MFPAFKEWQAVVDALAAGEQILILRKGGIAEGRGGFDAARAGRFWLFPTQFHAQPEKLKPAGLRFLANPPPDNATVTLRAFADVVSHTFLADWDSVARLDAFHVWSEEAAREKFAWARPPGLHVFVVRVHRLLTPVTLPLTPDMGGCKSWIEIRPAFNDHPAAPVLDEMTFAARRAGSGL